MEQIKSIVEEVIQSLQRKQKQWPEEEIEKIWTCCVKKKISQHTKVRFFKRGKLYVNTENPAWLYELKIKKESILERLQKLSKNKIKDISFRVGDVYGN